MHMYDEVTEHNERILQSIAIESGCERWRKKNMISSCGTSTERTLKKVENKWKVTIPQCHLRKVPHRLVEISGKVRLIYKVIRIGEAVIRDDIDSE